MVLRVRVAHQFLGSSGNKRTKVGRLISRHPSAYTYLPKTVAAFPVRKEFASLMQQAGFMNVTYKELTLGIVILYTGMKQV